MTVILSRKLNHRLQAGTHLGVVVGITQPHELQYRVYDGQHGMMDSKRGFEGGQRVLWGRADVDVNRLIRDAEPREEPADFRTLLLQQEHQHRALRRRPPEKWLAAGHTA